jgi:hypothetical protein
MRPSKSALFIASLSVSLLPPRIARVLTLLLLAALTGLAVWTHQSGSVTLGQVTEVLQLPGSSEMLVALDNGRQSKALRIPASLSDNSIQANDIVMANGQQRDVGGAAAYFDVDRLGVLPLSRYWAVLEQAWHSSRAAQTHPIGIALAGLVIVAFAHIVLRLGAAAIIGSLAGFLSFIFLQLNLQQVFVPIPPEQIETVLAAGAVIGAVIGFKALIRGSYRLGERGVAMLFAIPLVPLIGAEIPALVPFVWGVPILAILLPETTPILGALLLVRSGFNLNLIATSWVLAAMVVIRVLTRPKPAPRQMAATFTPQTDASGQFNLEQFLNTRREG